MFNPVTQYIFTAIVFCFAVWYVYKLIKKLEDLNAKKKEQPRNRNRDVTKKDD